MYGEHPLRELLWCSSVVDLDDTEKNLAEVLLVREKPRDKRRAKKDHSIIKQTTKKPKIGGTT